MSRQEEETFEDIQRSVELFCFGLTQRLLKLQRKAHNCQELCGKQDGLENFERITWEKVCSMFQQETDPLKKPVVALGESLLDPSTMLIIGSCDGSIVKGL